MNSPQAHPSYGADSFRSALPWVGFIATLFFFNFIGRIILSPLMVAIEADLGLSHAQAGRLYLGISIGFAITLFLSGFISSRLSHRTCIGLSATGTGSVMLALSAASSPDLVQLLIFVMGLTAGLYMPSGLSTIASLVHSRDLGKAMATHELAPNIGFFIAPLLAEFFLANYSWRIALGTLGGACLLAGLLFLIAGRGGTFTGAPPNTRSLGEVLRRPNYWLIVGMFVLAVSAAFTPYSILPLYLTDERGMSLTQANRLMALSRLAGPLMAIFSGWTADRFGARPTMRIYFVLCGLSTALLALPAGPWLVAAVIVQPVFSCMFFPAAFSVLARCFEPELRAIVTSFILPVNTLIGMGVAPAILGWLGDRGQFDTGLLVLGLLLLLGLPMLRRLKIDPV